MLFFLITCTFSFIFFYNSLVLKPLPHWACDMRFLSLWFLKHFSFSAISKSLGAIFSLPASPVLSKKAVFTSQMGSLEKTPEVSVLHLPDLVLETILEKLPPEGLCKMACVCTSLRDRCMSDHLWEKHINNKWARVVGPAAYREWRWQFALGKDSVFSQDKNKGPMGYLNLLWSYLLIWSSFRGHVTKKTSFRPTGPSFIMSLYVALESGKFWFPAQVYNRENGHFGFMLSCYDAELCYDVKTNTFQARYPPHGQRLSPTEIGITWDRFRASPVETSPYDLHISDCLNELRPGDHIEVQWRRKKEFPYGWWYGVVGHMDTCDGNTNHCRCHESDILVLVFDQYARGSRWRTTSIDRIGHREKGSEMDGFYGGVRKICLDEEISTWRKLWPSQVLE